MVLLQLRENPVELEENCPFFWWVGQLKADMVEACKVVPADRLMDESRTLAGEMAKNAPLAVQATKRMMRLSMEETFEANVHHVFLQVLPLFRSQDFTEGVRAFIERREPQFEGR